MAIFGLVVLILAFQMAQVALALRQARVQASELQEQVNAGDLKGARGTLDGLRGSAATAHGASDNLLWDAAAKVPVLGSSVEAVQLISSALDGVSREALPVGLDVVAAAREGAFQAEDGRFDLAAIRRVEPSLQGAAEAVERGDRQVGSIDPISLLSPLRRPVVDLKLRFGELDRAVGSAASVLGVLPPMLGSEGPRNYLLVAQNTAELRATGGLPGSLSIVSVRDGKLRLGFRGSANDFPPLQRPVLPLTADERDLYGNALGEDIRQTNQTPDFPRAAELMSAMVARERGIEVDGVISVDPIALSKILEAIGPIRVGEEVFTAKNVVAKVLNEVYQRFPTLDAQDRYFADVSRGVFDALTTTRSNQQALLRGVSSAVEEGRLLVWSNHAREQRTIEQGRVSGRLPRDTGATPHVGMYLNDFSAAKINYYLDYRGQLESVSCERDRSQTLVARMELSSSVPRPISSLSETITGPGLVGPKGSSSIYLRIYAPTGGKLTALSLDGAPTKIDVKQHEGREVSILRLRIDPGQKVEVLATIRTRPRQDGNAVLEWTPGMRRQINAFGAESACR